MTRRKSIQELNIVRAVAMIAVVIIHATAPSFGYLEETSTTYGAYLFINRFTRFCVPLFIFMSSFVLFYNYIHRDSNLKSWSTFYKKRIFFIVVPYLFWSIFYLIYSFTQTGIIPGISTLRVNFLFGTAKYHLYYIIVLIQFYFLFPFLIYVTKKSKLIRWGLVLIGVIIQFLFIEFNGRWQIFQHPGSIVFNYFGYLLIGAWVGVYYEKILEHTKGKLRYLFGSGIIMAILGVFHWLGSYQAKLGTVSEFTEQYNQIFFLFSCAAIVFFMLLSYQASKWNVKFTNVLLALGHYSFGIYLIHPFVLDINDKYMTFLSDINIHLFIIERFIVAISVSFLFVYLILKFVSFSWFLFGSQTSQLPKYQQEITPNK